MQSGQDQWCSLVLRRECFADAPLEQRDRRSCSCGLRMIVPWWRSHGSRSNLQQAAALAWHSVGDDDAVFDDFVTAQVFN